MLSPIQVTDIFISHMFCRNFKIPFTFHQFFKITVVVRLAIITSMCVFFLNPWQISFCWVFFFLTFVLFVHLPGWMGSKLQHVGSSVFVAACKIFSCSVWPLSCSMRDLVPWPEIKPGPPALRSWHLSYWATREAAQYSDNCSLIESAAFVIQHVFYAFKNIILRKVYRLHQTD